MDQGDLFGPKPIPFPLPPVSGLTADTWDASQAAADAVEPNAETLRAEVLRFIRVAGAEGATDDEIQRGLEMDGNTERPRRWELWKADLIFANGHRVNQHHRSCTVWCAR